jgi:protein involved in polysaccharide export with SLBB domain/capsular polysaccharide biosynthesis protein
MSRQNLSPEIDSTQPESTSDQPALNSRDAGGMDAQVPGNGSGTPHAPHIWKASFPIDPWRVLVAWRKNWWIAAAGFALAMLPAILLGMKKFEATYTANVQIIRRELPNSFRAAEMGEAFKPRQFSAATIVSIMRTPTLLKKVGEAAEPPVSSAQLRSALTITPEKNTELITVTLAGRKSRRETADLLNAYAREVIAMTQLQQQQEAAELDLFLSRQIEQTDHEISTVSRELVAFSREARFYGAETELQAYLRELSDAEVRLQTAQLDQQGIEERLAAIDRELAKQNPTAMKLAQAREQLRKLLVSYTASNPLVIEQQALVNTLEQESANAATRLADLPPDASSVINSLFLDRLSYKAQQQAITNQISALTESRNLVQAKLESVPEKSAQFARLKAREVSLESTRALLAGRRREAQLFAENSPGYYRLLAATTPEQVEQSSKGRKLFILALAAGLAGSLAGLMFVGIRELVGERVISPSDLRRAVRSPVLASLEELPGMTPEEIATWRFRTWSTLSQRLGFRAADSVALGIASTEPGEGRSTWLRLLAQGAADRGMRTLLVTNEPAKPDEASVSIAEALEVPKQVMRSLHAGQVRSLAVIVARDWEWTAERRTLFLAAVEQWLKLSRLAILVELPPAASIESVLLAAGLPHVLWLGSSGGAARRKTTELAEMARLGDVLVAGTLFNRLPRAFARLPDLSRFGLCLALGLGVGFGTARTDAQEATELDSPTFFSATAAGPKLAQWQEKLTLGAGDILNLSIYGRKDLTRTEVPIGPDGKINYLQANDVFAAGLTVDELREKLNSELAAYYRHARVMIWPAAYRSKKYFLLGAVTDRGVYPLDRPVSIIEAVARARGIATGLFEQNTIEIADLPRAFLIRNGQRMPVDFSKLFHEGDLTQNILLEPDDFMFFPSAVMNEVYVLGAVSSPGTVGVTDRATVLSSITKRGGFLPVAYRQRVLLVRGSLNAPETHVIDLASVLRGQQTDFIVEPKDIIYVAERPWARAEELLDTAIRAFAQTAVTVWSGGTVPALINR